MKRNTTKFNAIKIRESKTDVYKSLYYGSYLCSNTIMNKKTSTVKKKQYFKNFLKQEYCSMIIKIDK